MSLPLLTSADAVEEAFYAAMRRGDLQAMMALWSDDEEVVCVHPGGPRLIGLDAVRASWERILGGGAVNVEVTGVRSTTGAVLCVHNVIERVHVQGHRSAELVQCVATNVYVKGPRGWRMLIHHAGRAEHTDAPSPPPSGAVLH